MTNYKISSSLHDVGSIKFYIKEIESTQDGKGSIIVVHDALSYHKVYQKLSLEILRIYGYKKVIFIDLPGHGMSGGTRHFIENREVFNNMFEGFDFEQFADEKTLWLGDGFGASIFLYLNILNVKFYKDSHKFLLFNPFFAPKYSLPNFLDKEKISLIEKVRMPSFMYQRKEERDALIGNYLTFGLWNTMFSLYEYIKTYPYLIEGKILVFCEENHPNLKVEKLKSFLKGIPEQKIELNSYSNALDLHEDNDINKICKDIKNWLDL